MEWLEKILNLPPLALVAHGGLLEGLQWKFPTLPNPRRTRIDAVGVQQSESGSIQCGCVIMYGRVVFRPIPKKN